jgi:hypothetical protein
MITGASKGIAAAIARDLVDGGANVVLVARGAEALEGTADSLRAMTGDGQEVITPTVDVAIPSEIAVLFDSAADALPRLDVFVATAGTGHTRPLLELTLDEWQSMLDLNLRGVMLCCQGAAGRMLADGPDGDRSILVISSIEALQATPGRLACSTIKADRQPPGARRRRRAGSAGHPGQRPYAGHRRHPADPAISGCVRRGRRQGTDGPRRRRRRDGCRGTLLGRPALTVLHRGQSRRRWLRVVARPMSQRWHGSSADRHGRAPT